MKIGCYARVSTHDQQTLALQRDAMAAYAQQRGWSIVASVTEQMTVAGLAARYTYMPSVALS